MYNAVSSQLRKVEREKVWLLKEARDGLTTILEALPVRAASKWASVLT